MAYSYAVTVASGSTPNVAVPFPYIGQGDVHVQLNGVETLDFTWIASGTIQLGSTPAAGTAIKVYRTTDATKLLTVYSTPNVLDHRDWNRVLTQMLYVTQEAFDLGAATAESLQDVIDYVNSAMAAAAESAANAATSETNAAGSATAAAASASSAAGDAATVAAAIPAIVAARDAALADLNTAADQAYADIGAAGATAVGDVNNAKDTALTEVAASSGAAATSATNAATYEGLAHEWADKAEDSAVTGHPGEYSAMHWAKKAAAVVSDGVSASTVPFTPGGGISATDVQAAILELDSEKADAAATATSIAAKADDSRVDAVAGAEFVVKAASAGLSNERVLTDGSEITWDWSVTGVVKAVLAAASVTFAHLAAAAVATASEFMNATADKLLTADKVWDAIVPQSIGGTGTVTVDCSTGCFFKSDLSGATTYAISNIKDGQSITITAYHPGGSPAITAVNPPAGVTKQTVSGAASGGAWGTIITCLRSGGTLFVSMAKVD